LLLSAVLRRANDGMDGQTDARQFHRPDPLTVRAVRRGAISEETRCRQSPAAPLAADVHRISSVDKTEKIVVLATSLEKSRNYFIIIIDSHSSTNCEKLANIGQV